VDFHTQFASILSTAIGYMGDLITSVGGLVGAIFGIAFIGLLLAALWKLINK
jgi:hypothetical protein